MEEMNKKIILLLLNSLFLLPVYGQEGDVEVITDSDRSITLANRVFSRPQMIDTSISVDVINYPLLVLKESVSVDVAEINPANVRLRPQLAQLYNGYAKLGLGSRLQTLGEVYYNSVRSRKANWGFHGLHHGEWGRINDYAPSQYDHTKLKAFGDRKSTRLNSSHVRISYAVFCLKKKKKKN